MTHFVRDRRRGLSLVELLMAMVVLGLLMAIFSYALRGARPSAETRSVANVLAEELRLARREAIAKHTFVAVVFPSGNGTRPSAQSYYRVEGDTAPKVTRVVDFIKDYRSVCAFNGYWDLDPSKLQDPTRTNTVSQPQTGTPYDSFDVTRWNPVAMSTWGGSGSDYAFIFTPAGTVRTNGLVNFDNEFHVVVSQGVAYQAAARPPLALGGDGFVQCFADLSTDPTAQYFKLLAVSRAFTIKISALGKVTVVPGVPAASGVVDSTNPVPGSTPASPAVTPDLINHAPLLTLTLAPTPNPATLPPGVNASVGRDGRVTIRARATDEDGDRLFCTWTGERGSLSMSGEQRMEWSEAEAAWVAAVEWKPAADAADGESATVRCDVIDKRGGSADASRLVQVAAGKIAFASSRDGNWEVYVMDADGSKQRSLSNNPALDNNPVWSPDGTRIAFVSWRDGNGEVYVMNADGTAQTNLTNNPAGEFDNLAFSADGTRIGFVSDRDANYEIYAVNVDGTGLTRLTNNYPHRDFISSWSPDGTRIAFTFYQDGDFRYRTWVMNADGTARTRLSSTADDYHPAWSPDGTRIAFTSTRDGNYEIYVMKADGTAHARLTSNAADDYGPCWSPDSTRIAFTSNRDGNLEIYSMNADGTGQTRMTNNAAPDVWPSWSR